MFRLAVILCTSLLSAANGYSTGAPTSTCVSLLPGHGQTAQNKLVEPVPSPYSITVQGGDQVDNNGFVPITISGSRPFEGFIIVAEYVDVNNTRFRSGTWSSSNPLVKTACDDGSGMTHANNSAKLSIDLQWKPPAAPFTGYVSFWGSFVESFNTYWIELSGQQYVNVGPTTTAAVTTPLPDTTQSLSTNGSSSVQTTESTVSQATNPQSTNGAQPSATRQEETSAASANRTTASTIPATNPTKPKGTSMKPKSANNVTEHPNNHPQLRKKKTSQVQDQVSGGRVLQASLLICAIIWVAKLL